MGAVLADFPFILYLSLKKSNSRGIGMILFVYIALNGSLMFEVDVIIIFAVPHLNANVVCFVVSKFFSNIGKCWQLVSLNI